MEEFKNRKPTFEEVVSAFICVLDGQSQWYEIQQQTGLDETMCREIQAIFNALVNDNN